MPTFRKPRKGRRVGYRVNANPTGIQVEFDEDFWNSEIIDGKGTTALDQNIRQICQEIRAALYYIGTTGPRH